MQKQTINGQVCIEPYFPWGEGLVGFGFLTLFSRQAQEYLSLEQIIKSVTKVTKKFIERALLFLEYAANEDMDMCWYISMMKTKIKELMVNSSIRSFQSCSHIPGR